MALMLPPFTVPREANANMDGRVLLFALIVSIATGLLFGMAPALQATKPDLAAAMNRGTNGTTPNGTVHVPTPQAQVQPQPAKMLEQTLAAKANKPVE